MAARAENLGSRGAPVSQAALAHILLSGLLEMKAPAVRFSLTVPFCSLISLSLLLFHMNLGAKRLTCEAK